MTDASPTPPAALSERLPFFGTVDRFIFRVETVVVVTALILMSVMVFTDVVYQLAVSIGQHLEKGESQGFVLGGFMLAFVGLIAFAATGDNRTLDEREAGGESTARPLPVRVAVTVAATVGTALFGWSLLHLESSTVYRVVTLAAAVPIGRAFWLHGSRVAFGAFVGGTVLAVALFGSLPTGYSWSQSYSLILLLWVSFLGASIAARERRHLRIDLVRKLLPPSKLPLFNALSYLVAATFTGAVLYLGWIYIFGADSTYLRPIWDAPAWLPEGTRKMLMEDFPLAPDASAYRRAMQVLFAPTEPGELPDWLKVAAIPVSMFLICLRFIGHSVVFTQMALRGEEFSEAMETH